MKGLTIYQCVLIFLITLIWTILGINGYLSKFDVVQWTVMIFFTLLTIAAVYITELFKSQ